jgi:hypothetical protein
MVNRSAIRLYALAGLTAALALVASPARAQYRPRPLNDPATGETYHIEGAAGWWLPKADMSIASESLGLVGTTIDFKQDLGLQDQRFPELHLVLRPATKHKFRFQYIPIKYEQTATVRRAIVFNGQRYNLGLPVSSTLDWKAYRLGYEYDFVVTNRGFGGFVLDFKYTDVMAKLTTPSIDEFAHARAPIPTIGGIFRAYPVPNISITGEITGFKLPENVVKGDTAHYLDVDFYGTLNFTNNVGAQIGYRSFDVGYVIKKDTGNFTVKGMYFGLVARY